MKRMIAEIGIDLALGLMAIAAIVQNGPNGMPHQPSASDRSVYFMPRATALEMVKQAVYGAATMLRDSGEHPVILREAVTSPGGTTAAGLRALERAGTRSAFLDAVLAATERSRELGAQ